jgi:MFS family permease
MRHILLNKEPKTTFLGICVWAIAIVFFLYEYFLRVLPATDAKNIIASLDISLEEFSLVGSAYYITYAIMQIPVGVLLDRFSVKTLMTVACAICTLGMVWLSVSHSFIPAFIARLFIGLGSSFGFVGIMVLALNWFPRRLFAGLTGLGLFLGCLGPLVAGAPAAHLIAKVPGGWRPVFLWVSLFGGGLTILIWILVKGKQKNCDVVIYAEREIPLKKQIRSLVGTKEIWWTFVFGAMTFVTIPVIGAFWGTSYIHARGYPTTTAAFIVSMMWFGLAIGSLGCGKLSEWMHRRKPVCITVSAIGIVTTLLLIFLPQNNKLILCTMFFLIGLSAGGQNIAFALTTDLAPKVMRATALGLNNTVSMLFASLVPLLVTAIINFNRVEGQVVATSFEKGFFVLPICFGIALLVIVFGIKETFCRQQNAIHKIGGE